MDRAALENYKNNPRRREISAYCKPARTDRTAADFKKLTVLYCQRRLK